MAALDDAFDGAVSRATTHCTLKNPFTMNKLHDFEEAAEMMFAEYGESANPSAHVLTPLGQSPRGGTGFPTFNSYLSHPNLNLDGADQQMNDERR